MKLDLGVLKQDTLDITLINGSVVSIRKPPKHLLIEINKVDMELSNCNDIEELISRVEYIASKILSNNTQNIEFKADKLEENDIDYAMQVAIFKEYMKFISHFVNNPN